ncbi:MAG: DUF389 domain-containing protein [Bacteroidales bacterium]|nr:DUF389 domain-containing protein [Bacteroidales bacterium]
MRFSEYIKRIINPARDVDKTAAQNYIYSNVQFRGANVWILFFAVIIASVGLNVNSIPVLIGAMLISPLMGPIMGIGMALGINDMAFLRKSLRNLCVMTIVSIVASTLFFAVTPLSLDEPTELLARTNPTIYDVFIALFGGFAVIVEVCRKERGTAIAGAAIATALMPPLCTVGYGIANANFTYFIGALYLYFINSVFIILATFLIVRVLKFPFVNIADPLKRKKVHHAITAFIIILIIPSIYSAIIVIQETRFNQVAKSFVAENKYLENSYINDYKAIHRAHKPSIISISIAGEKLSQADISKLNRSMSEHGLSPEQLEIQHNVIFTNNNSGAAGKQVVESLLQQNEREVQRREDEIKKLEQELKQFHNKEFPYKQIAKELLAQYPTLVSMTLARGENINATEEITYAPKQERVVAVLSFAGKINEDQLKRLKEWLAIRLDVKEIDIIVQ